MANLLRGIAQGTKETVQQTAKDVGRKALSTMPSPSNAMYNLGLGVGPLIRNIVEASKEKPTKSGPEAPVSKKEFADVTKASVGQTAELLQLTRTSISLLRDIKTEMVKSNRAAGQSRRTAPARATGSVTARPLAGMIPGASYTPQDRAVVTIKEKVTQGTDVLGTILSGLMAAGGAAAIFQLLPDNIKSELGKSALQFANTVGKDVIDGVGGLLQKAWAADSTATAIAAIAVAKVTGLLGVATGIAKGTIEAGKGVYTLGKAMTTPTVPTLTPTPAPAPAPAPAPTVPKPVGPAPGSLSIANLPGMKGPAGPTSAFPAPGSFSTANLPGMQGPAGPTSPLPVGPKPVGPAPGSFSTANLPGMQGPAGPTSPLPQAAETPGSKTLGAAKTIGKLGLAGTAASLGLSGYNYYQTGEAEKKGLITGQQATVQKSGIVGEAGGGLAAGLYGAGKGALVGSAFGPAGTIVGGVVGGVAGSYAGSKLGKYVGESFGKVKNFFRGTPSTTDGEAAAGTMPSPADVGAGTQGPAPSATQPQQTGPINFASTRFSDLTEEQKVAFLDAQAISEGFGRPGTMATRQNNPGNIRWVKGGFAEKYGGGPGAQEPPRPDGSPGPVIAAFPTLEQGRAAHRALWEGRTYSNLTIDQALQRWVGKDINTTHYVNAISKIIKQRGVNVTASPTPAMAATAPGSVVSPQNVQTSSASAGTALAQQQDMYSAFVSAMAGENVTVNLSQVIQNAMSEGSRGGGPAPAGPASRGAALERAHRATG